MTFEQALQRLDEIVSALGDGHTTLEQSLALYAEGAALTGQCTKELSEAKKTLEILGLKDGEADELS